jgi:hypothetical protein
MSIQPSLDPLRLRLGNARVERRGLLQMICTQLAAEASYRPVEYPRTFHL